MAILVIGIGDESNHVIEELNKLNINVVDVNCVRLLSTDDACVDDSVMDVDLMGDDSKYYRHSNPQRMGEELIRELVDNNTDFIKDLIVAGIMEKWEERFLCLPGEKNAYLPGKGWSKDKKLPFYYSVDEDSEV